MREPREPRSIIDAAEKAAAAGDFVSAEQLLREAALLQEERFGAIHPDLAKRLARGPVPIAEALPIARQIAAALEAAHDAGIVHRDLKPANIKVSDDGVVKVLDFGLAKAIGPATGIGQPATEILDSPTITTPAMTQAGMILGTAAYMSPEQAKGRPADKRADVWAFGCVLYEMLTARRAFAGDDTTETIAAIIRADPDWTRLAADTPESVRRLLRRCLAKDPYVRLADIRDARLEIDDAQRPSPTEVAASDRSRRRERADDPSQDRSRGRSRNAGHRGLPPPRIVALEERYTDGGDP